jgi:hypothetical protein
MGMSESEAKTISFTSSASVPVPPYVPYRSFRNFIESLKQGIPARIDRSVMASMSGALQSQLTACLRYLELITSASHPTPVLPRLVNSEGPEHAKVLRDIITKSYPFLFTHFDIKTATPRMLEEQFANAGASGGTIDKCVNFFLAAAKEAGVELSPHLKSNRQRIQRRPRGPRDPSVPIANGSDVDESAGSGQMVTWAQMLLSKFPSFDPSWPDDVKTKWFDAFDKLMKQEPKKEAS